MFRPNIAATVLLLTLLSAAPLTAQKPPESSAVPLSEAEQAFVNQMTNAVLVGSFSISGRDDRPARPERYAISGVTKLGENRWIITARITYGDVDVPVPVPVQIFWADDTPVISLTDLSIPGLGAGFTTRVLFYEDRYAGTWYHGKAGGHMWGTIEKAGEKPDSEKQDPPGSR